MARTALTVQTIVQAGIVPTYVAATTDGHSFINNGNTFLAIINAHTSATMTATVQHPGQIDGLAVADQPVEIAGGATKYLGPFSARFHQPGTTDVYVDMSTTAASVAALRIG